MTPELTALTLAALVQVVTFVAYAIPANRELGRGYTMSARDRDPTKTMTDGTARLGRAMNNMFEALILFGIAVLVVQLSGQNTRYTAILSWLFLFARVLYVPAYYYAWRPGRSMIWVLGMAATVLLLLAALF
ncbi:MAG TPA: MAPEG family protein [Roseobacter sp.]|uniref:Inner membrane protein n=1 Tax=marine sediment metagenome TaxID=412755 RepID=A0A0F9RAX5_9ZZZZ|nr:MAPEG family protein [Roseobacter sp.]